MSSRTEASFQIAVARHRPSFAEGGIIRPTSITRYQSIFSPIQFHPSTRWETNVLRFTLHFYQRTLTRRRAPPAINRALFYERFVNPSQLECQLHFFELCSARSIGNFALERVRSTKFREIRENFATQESILLSIHVLRKIIRSPSVLHLWSVHCQKIINLSFLN